MFSTIVTDIAQTEWDNETHGSAYSTVCEADGSDYCEACDQNVNYSDSSNPHGTCGCEN